jgi:hypothetical protein
MISRPKPSYHRRIGLCVPTPEHICIYYITTCWNQGCQMAYFQTKNPDLGKFLRVLQWKMSVYYMSIVYFTATWYILRTFGIFCGYLVYFFPFWYVIPRKIWQPWLEHKLLYANRAYYENVDKNSGSINTIS